MPLPILHKYSSSADVLRLALHAQKRLGESISEPVELDIGTAFANPDLPRVRDANCVRDVSIPDGMTPAEVFARVESHYTERHLSCGYWMMNSSVSSQRIAPMVQYLLDRGFRPHSEEIHLLVARSQIHEVPELKIIPARAAYGHVKKLADESATADGEPQLAEAIMRLLDDPHWDALLALRGTDPVAMAGVLAVGEVGLVDKVYVASAHRRLGIGRTTMASLLDLCGRAMFRQVVIFTNSGDASASAFCASLGFRPVAQSICYLTPPA